MKFSHPELVERLKAIGYEKPEEVEGYQKLNDDKDD